MEAKPMASKLSVQFDNEQSDDLSTVDSVAALAAWVCVWVCEGVRACCCLGSIMAAGLKTVNSRLSTSRMRPGYLRVRDCV